MEYLNKRLKRYRVCGCFCYYIMVIVGLFIVTPAVMSEFESSNTPIHIVVIKLIITTAINIILYKVGETLISMADIMEQQLDDSSRK